MDKPLFIGRNYLEGLTAKYYESYLLLWLEKNFKEKANEPVNLDMIDCVNLLQCIGFRMRRIDAVSAQDASTLRGGDNGVRVVITCSHSGQRCILEYPTISESCSCSVIENNNGKDGYWEVTASTGSKQESLIETGCSLIPPITRRLIPIVNMVVGELMGMMRGKFDKNILTCCDPLSLMKEREFQYTPMSETSMVQHSIIENFQPNKQEIVPIVITPHSSDVLICRSMDSLIEDKETSVKPNILLPKSLSTPNMSSLGETDEVEKNAYGILEKACNNLLEALNIFKSFKNPSIQIKSTVTAASETYEMLMNNLTPKSDTTSSGISIKPSAFFKSKSSSNLALKPNALKARSSMHNAIYPTRKSMQFEKKPVVNVKKEINVKTEVNVKKNVESRTNVPTRTRKFSLPAASSVKSLACKKCLAETTPTYTSKLTVPMKKDLQAKVLNKNAVCINDVKAKKK